MASGSRYDGYRSNDEEDMEVDEGQKPSQDKIRAALFDIGVQRRLAKLEKEDRERKEKNRKKEKTKKRSALSMARDARALKTILPRAVSSAKEPQQRHHHDTVIPSGKKLAVLPPPTAPELPTPLDADAALSDGTDVTRAQLPPAPRKPLIPLQTSASHHTPFAPPNATSIPRSTERNRLKRHNTQVNSDVTFREGMSRAEYAGQLHPMLAEKLLSATCRKLTLTPDQRVTLLASQQSVHIDSSRGQHSLMEGNIGEPCAVAEWTGFPLERTEEEVRNGVTEMFPCHCATGKMYRLLTAGLANRVVLDSVPAPGVEKENGQPDWPPETKSCLKNMGVQLEILRGMPVHRTHGRVPFNGWKKAMRASGYKMLVENKPYVIQPRMFHHVESRHGVGCGGKPWSELCDERSQEVYGYGFTTLEDEEKAVVLTTLEGVACYGRNPVEWDKLRGPYSLLFADTSTILAVVQGPFDQTRAGKQIRASAAGAASAKNTVAFWLGELDNDTKRDDKQLFGLLAKGNMLSEDAMARVLAGPLVSVFARELSKVDSAAGTAGGATSRKTIVAFWLKKLENDTKRDDKQLYGLLAKGNMLSDDAMARVLAKPLVSVFAKELSKVEAAGAALSTNRGTDRGQNGERGAVAWGLVLHEIAQKHVDPENPTERFFEHYVHATNDGKNGGAGSKVGKDNFMSYARVRVSGKQKAITTHKRDRDIVRARVVRSLWMSPWIGAA